MTPTIPQMIDRHNRAVRRARRWDAFDRWAMRLLVPACVCIGIAVGLAYAWGVV